MCEEYRLRGFFLLIGHVMNESGMKAFRLQIITALHRICKKESQNVFIRSLLFCWQWYKLLARFRVHNDFDTNVSARKYIICDNKLACTYQFNQITNCTQSTAYLFPSSSFQFIQFFLLIDEHFSYSLLGLSLKMHWKKNEAEKNKSKWKYELDDSFALSNSRFVCFFFVFHLTHVWVGCSFSSHHE